MLLGKTIQTGLGYHVSIWKVKFWERLGGSGLFESLFCRLWSHKLHPLALNNILSQLYLTFILQIKSVLFVSI